MRSLALVALLAACGGTPTLPGLSAGETTGAGTDARYCSGIGSSGRVALSSPDIESSVARSKGCV